MAPETFKFKSDASQFLAETETKIRPGEWIDPGEGRVLFREYADKWRPVQVHRPSTAAQIESHLRNHVYPRIGDRQLGQVRKSDIQALVKYLSEESAGHKALAPATVEVIYTWVATIFAAAVDDLVLPRTPCVKIKLPAVEHVTITQLLVDTAWRLITGISERYRALVALGAGTGVRISEGLGLTNDRVDWLRREVTVDRQLNGIGPGRQPVFGPLKDKDNRPRTIPLPNFVVEELSAHVARFDTGPSGLIFTGPNGGPVRRTTFSDNWRDVAEPLGIRLGEGFHQLRHFYASLLIESGQSVKTIQQYLGHRSAVLTLDTYGHLWPEGEDLTRAAVDDAFGSLVARMLHGQRSASS